MELKIRRLLARETRLVNDLLKDPDIRPTALIGHTATDGVDLLSFLAEERNIAFICEDEEDVPRGAILFHWNEFGVYEVHTMCQKIARGISYLNAVRGAISIMFLHGDCIELYTRVPEENKGALGLVRLIHGKREFSAAPDSPGAPAMFYALRWYDWIWSSDSRWLVKHGEWFHTRLEEQFAEQGRKHAAHEDNEDHDRMVGVTCELILNGMVQKAFVLYNRWAKLAGYAQLQIVVENPLIINTGDALLQVDFAKRDFLLLDIAPGDLKAA